MLGLEITRAGAARLCRPLSRNPCQIAATAASIDLGQWFKGETAEHHTMHDTNTASTDSLQGLRILVVEDTPAVVNALKTFLEDLGMAVVGPVSTPHAAMQLLAKRPPDVALVDMHLDGDTGYDLVERMRQAKVPLIAMSGSVDDLPAGGPRLASLQKPFSGQELMTTLGQVVRAKQSSHSQKS